MFGVLDLESLLAEPLDEGSSLVCVGRTLTSTCMLLVELYVVWPCLME